MFFHISRIHNANLFLLKFYASNDSVHSLLPYCPLHCLSCRSWQPDYSRSKVTRVPCSPHSETGAGRRPVIDRVECPLLLTRDLVHYHLSPSLSVTTIYHPAPPPAAASSVIGRTAHTEVMERGDTECTHRTI